MLDDTGVFDTSLSWEYIHVSTAYGVSMQDILALSCNNLFYDLSFKIMDPTLPRTKDFICPNKECETNKNTNLATREAIIFRENRSFITRYVCTTCTTDWIAQ